MDKNELYHYGVLGMKWGVRKAYSNFVSGRRQKKLQKQRVENLAKARKARSERTEALKKGRIKAKDMTAAELQKEITRMKLEKDYLDLKRQTGRDRTDRGKSFVEKYAGDAVNKIIWNTAVDLAAQSIKTVGAKKINEEFRKRGFDSDVVFTNNKRKS